MPLSTKQMEYLALAWQCFNAEPKIDYEKFKTVAGLASAASARELMRVTKKKLREEYGVLSGGMQNANTSSANSPVKKGTPKSSTATPRSNKRKKMTIGETDATADEDNDESPTKRAKKTATPRKVKAEPKVDSDDEMDMFRAWKD